MPGSAYSIGTGYSSIQAINAKNNIQDEIPSGHALAIIGSDDKYIYLEDPNGIGNPQSDIQMAGQLIYKVKRGTLYYSNAEIFGGTIPKLKANVN